MTRGGVVWWGRGRGTFGREDCQEGPALTSEHVYALIMAP